MHRLKLYVISILLCFDILLSRNRWEIIIVVSDIIGRLNNLLYMSGVL